MYNKLVLDNGLRIVTENIPYVKSVSIGIWIETGSRQEKDVNNGISHFIEHMLFKGTTNRSAKKIAESIDNIGGQLNAFTSKECTCFYAKVLDNHLEIAIDVLADMMFNSKFSQDDIEKEKSVVIEEINMYEDSPEDVVHDLLGQSLFDGHPLAYPILGKENILKSLTRKDIIDYFNRHYTPDNTVISVVGNFDYDKTVKKLINYFGQWKGEKINNRNLKPTILNRKVVKKDKSTEQLHLCIGMEGVAQGKDDLYALLVLNNIFGGSMSSRLFQKIREEQGLVYSIYSYPSSYKDIGIFTIYAGLNSSQLLTVSNLIKEEIIKLKKGKLTEEEVLRSKEQLKGNLILGLESTSSRMTSLGKSELLLGKVYSPKDILNKIDKITLKDVKSVIEKVFDSQKYNIAYVGKLKDEVKTIKNLEEVFFEDSN